MSVSTDTLVEWGVAKLRLAQGLTELTALARWLLDVCNIYADSQMTNVIWFKVCICASDSQCTYQIMQLAH